MALAARIAAIGAVGFSTLRFGDARVYLTAAETLLHTGHYPKETDYHSFRAPGYPVFLIAATLGDPRRVPLAKLANAAAGALSALLLAALSARIFRRRSVALATGAVAALDPGLVLTAADIQSEPLFLLLLLVAAWMLLVCVDRPSSNFGVLAGAALALAALTRPTALAMAPLLLAPFGDRRWPLRVRAHLAGSTLLGFFLTLAPWTLRNAVVYRELVPVSDLAGVNLYLGNSDLMARFYELRTPGEYDAWIREMKRITDEKHAILQAAGEVSPSQRTRAYLRTALEERRRNPGATAGLWLHKLWDWVRPYPNPLFWPSWVVIPVGVFYILLSAFAVRGFLRSTRRGVRLFAAAVLVVSLLA
ncbi:MAG: glycosyltransferase family 39 protein, partial [Thermoanaerobaculia bacterium]